MIEEKRLIGWSGRINKVPEQVLLNAEPDTCPKCIFDFRPVRGTTKDVIGIFSLQRDFLMGYKCPHCLYEWSHERPAQLAE